MIKNSAGVLFFIRLRTEIFCKMTSDIATIYLKICEIRNIIPFLQKECAKRHKEDTKSHCFFFQFQLRYKWYHVNVDEEGDIRLTAVGICRLQNTIQKFWRSMNMKKKILSGLMAMTMAAMSMGLSAFAADDVQVTIGKAEVEPGAAFSVDVELGSVPSSGLSSIDFAISYDSSLIKIDKVELGSAGKTGADSQEGDLGDTLFSWYDTGKQIVVVWATGLTDSQYWVKSSGKFLTLSGTAKTTAGTAELKGGAVDRAAYPGSSAKADVVFSAVGDTTKDYSAAFTNGEVKIGAPETTPAPIMTTAPATKWGDATCDGKVDVSDAVLICRFAVSDAKAVLTDAGKANADVTHDASVNAEDASKILKYIARLITAEDLEKA